MIDQLEGQVSMFDLDSPSGRMCLEHSVQAGAKTSKQSSKLSAKSPIPTFQFLSLRGGWSKSGCVVGKGYSVAWRVYDAQYWGVPQRRKRIYLVADFASERAGEILFESEGVSRNPETSRETREGTSEDAEGGAGGSSGDGVGAFMGGMGAKARTIGYSETSTPTIRSVMSGGNTIPDVVYPNVARTLTSEADASFCIDRGQNVLCYGISPYASNAMLSSNPHSGIYEAKTSRTLDLNGGNPACNQGGVVVAIDCRNMAANNDVSATIQSKNQGGHSLNYINPIIYESEKDKC